MRFFRTDWHAVCFFMGCDASPETRARRLSRGSLRLRDPGAVDRGARAQPAGESARAASAVDGGAVLRSPARKEGPPRRAEFRLLSAAVSRLRFRARDTRATGRRVEQPGAREA